MAMMAGGVKMPKAPDRPLAPYMRYSRKMWGKVRADHPEDQLWDISKRIGQLWKDVPDNEKAVYQHEYDVEKVEYEKMMKAYQNSPAYQAYINQKNATGANPKGKPSRSRIDQGGVVLQPVDEDPENNELAVRKLAAIRYERNQRLIAELFNPSIVHDSRTVVAQQRIDLLKKQAESLMVHQKKLEGDLTKIDDVFNERKRTIDTASQHFALKLQKVVEEKPVVEESKYEEMVNEWKMKLGAAYEEMKKREEEMQQRLAWEREKMAEKTPVLYNLTIGNGKEEEKQATRRDQGAPLEGEKKEERKEDATEEKKEERKEEPVEEKMEERKEEPVEEKKDEAPLDEKKEEEPSEQKTEESKEDGPSEEKKEDTNEEACEEKKDEKETSEKVDDSTDSQGNAEKEEKKSEEAEEKTETMDVEEGKEVEKEKEEAMDTEEGKEVEKEKATTVAEADKEDTMEGQETTHTSP